MSFPLIETLKLVHSCSVGQQDIEGVYSRVNYTIDFHTSRYRTLTHLQVLHGVAATHGSHAKATSDAKKPGDILASTKTVGSSV